MDDRARREPPAPYDTFEEASVEARALGTRNRLEYEYFVELCLDPRLPKEPDTHYPDFREKGGWDAFLGKKPIIRLKPDPPPRTEPAPAPPIMAVPTLAPAPDPASSPVVEAPPVPVATPEPEAPIPLPGGAKPSVLTGRPKRPKPLPVEETYEEPPPAAKKPPPAPKKPATPRMRREDLKTEEAKRIFDMFRCITGDWDD